MTQEFEAILARWGNKAGLSRGAGNSMIFQSSIGFVEIEISEVAPDVAELRHTWSAPEWLAKQHVKFLPSLGELARSFANQRDALLTATAEGGSIRIVIPLYLEGISRQAFMSAVAEVARIVEALTWMVRDLESQREILDSLQSTIVETASVGTPVASKTAVAPVLTTAEGVCRRCGAAFTPGSLVCTACGAPVQAQPHAQSAVPQGLVCRNCGSSLTGQQRFCVQCGTGVI